MKQKIKGFTLIEFLIGISMTALIFVVSTNLMLGFLNLNTKSKRSQDVEQAKSNISAELTDVMQWASHIAFDNGVLTADGNMYQVKNGVFMKNDVPFTNSNVVITQFNVKQFSDTTAQTGNGNGLFANYFKNQDFTDLAVSQIDPLVDFNWNFGSPVAPVSNDHFSVEWLGQVKIPYPGVYTFYITSDDGAKLYIDNQVIIDSFGSNGLTTSQGSVSFTSSHMAAFRLQYQENFSQARISAYWSGPGFTRTIIPTSSLYSVNALPSFEVHVDLKHIESDSVHDSLKMFISPRFNN